MEKDLRRSSRPVKINRIPGFIYDEESVSVLASSRKNSSESRQRRRQVSESARSTASDGSPSVSGSISAEFTRSDWLALYRLPLFPNKASDSENPSNSGLVAKSKLSQSRSSNNSVFEDEGACAVTSLVNNSKCVDFRTDGGVSRQHSSTRYDLLERAEVFLSVSSSVRANSSDMPLSDLDGATGGEKSCECEEGQSCAHCAASGGGDGEPDLAKMMGEMLKKMDFIHTEVKSLKRTSNAQNNRLKLLEKQSDASESSDASIARKSSTKKKVNKGSLNKVKEKQARVIEERERDLRVLLDELDEIRQKEPESEEDLSSEDDVNLKKVQSKMSSKQKRKSKQIVKAIMKKVGGSFPEEDYTGNCASGSSESGTDSETEKKKSSSRRKVKSGAKVKKRPVIQTELWPHTIANEDDGLDVTSETISLSKFLSCFAFIMVSCDREKPESAGRTVLLYAVTSVLECLPWPEARSFHNLIMTKIEQGMVDWTTDFTELSEDFLTKKSRQSMRYVGATTSSSTVRNYDYNRSIGKGFGSGYNRPRYTRSEFTPGRGRTSISDVCRLWNGGVCSFGANCKKWHCCSACFNEGKVGEPHKAITHDSSAPRGRQNDRRV